MLENRINALAEFLKVVPKTVRASGARIRDDVLINDSGEILEGTYRDSDGEVNIRFAFDPEVHNIVGVSCTCRAARQGKVCEHICALAGQCVDEYYSVKQNTQSLDFLDKHFSTPSFQSPQFRLSIELTEHSNYLEPEILFHKFIKEGTFGVGRKFTPNDSYKFTQGDPADQNMLDYVRHFRQIFFYSNYEPTARYPWGFWLTLLEHPRVSCDDTALEVRAATVTLSMFPQGEDYRLEIFHEEDQPNDLHYFPVDGGLLAFSRKESKLLVCQVSRFRTDLLMDVHQFKPLLTRSELLTNLPRLEKLQTIFDISLPSELEGVIRRTPPRLVLILDMDVSRDFTLSPRAAYEESSERVIPGSAGQYLSATQNTVIERDLEAERKCYKDFLNLYPFEEDPDKNHEIHVEDLDHALVVIDWLKQQKHWDLEWVKEAPNIRRISNVQGLRVQIDSKAWLKIHLMADKDSFSMPFFPSEDHYLSSSRYVAVGDNEWIEIDQQLRQQINRLKMAIEQDDKAMKLKKAAMALLSDMTELQWEGDQVWLDKVEEWRGKGADRYFPDKKLQATLRTYQIEGYRWLRRLSELGVGACLADDMGLGKTVQALAITLDRVKDGPILVVAPASVCYNWREEISKFTPHLNPILYSEGRRSRSLSRLKKGEIIILSYAMVLKDIKKLKEVHWGTLILDEAQFVKNALSQTAMAVAQLDRKWTLALTGTPLENHLGELWSIFRMLTPDLLKSWEHFRKTYVIPIEKEHDPQKLEDLRRLIQPFILRRTKQNVLTDLPARSDILIKVELGEAQRLKYESERKRILAQLDESDEGMRFKLLAAITRLRQIACHPLLCEDKYKGESAKLKLFVELVEELVSENHMVLVFSQFTSFLSLIARELNRSHLPHLVMTGETPVKHRQAIIDKFQSGEVPVFLVSLRAGGTGLNLTSANYVIHMDPWWNPAVEEQATDRAHRIGQTQAVTVYRLVAENTIEESIIDIHGRKKDLVDGILEGKDKVGKLSINDLISLIKGES